MTRLLAVWMTVWMVGLVFAGCTAHSGPAVPSPSATLLPAETLSPTFTPEPVPVAPATKEARTVAFTVVYDNNVHDPALRTAWGFSCWIDTGEMVVLFDTGGDGATLLGNMAALELDPAMIEVVVLSHIHGDHTGGLAGLLDVASKPTVYVPAAFPESFKADVRARTDLVEVTGPVEISPGVYTTGQVGSGIVEQALAVETAAGWVVVTGCAHPGIVQMVRRAKEITDGEVALVMGGFHLGGASRSQVERIIADFRDMDVRQVAPSHCTGDQARQVFADAYGADCALAGVGWVVRMD